MIEINEADRMFAKDRTAFISALDDYSLLLLDDLGVERNTEYALEQIFLVINSRYRNKKPLIVTSNLKLEEIRTPPAKRAFSKQAMNPSSPFFAPSMACSSSSAAVARRYTSRTHNLPYIKGLPDPARSSSDRSFHNSKWG